MSLLAFGPFRLDLRDERLWRGQEVRPLTPTAFAVLRCLVAHPGRLVTKAMLLDTVWPETAISEATLTGYVGEVRRALGDSARHPQYLETVHGRGYRFIAPLTAPPSSALPLRAEERPPPRSPGPAWPATRLVGREAELAQLGQWYETARQGQRQVGLIGGEPGIGKTALVEAFVAQVATPASVWVAYGQCIAPYGAGEPYLPLLEALGRLCRGPDGAAIVAVLRQVAPSWLLHLPAVLSPADREALARTTPGVTSARMLRELVDALDMMTGTRPVILVLEDLHWSDTATVEWLHYVARRRDPAPLLVLGTYRPVDVIARKHPLQGVRAELRQLPQCQEVVLDYLSETAVAAYLTHRFGAVPQAGGLAPILHQRTNGNPLFLLAVVDALVSQQILYKTQGAWDVAGSVAAVAEVLPASLQTLIEQHVAQLARHEQAVLEAASVAGSTFTVAAVAAGVAQPDETIDRDCATWAQQGRFVCAQGIERWPDGTVTACYRFRHALYHDVIYRRVTAGQRVRLHRCLGIRLEAGYGPQASAQAAALADHFVRGHDVPRALSYLQQAAQNALQRSAYQETISHLRRGLALLATLPETPTRAQQELAFQIALGPVIMATQGTANPEVEQIYGRAQVLCQQVDDTPHRFQTVWGLCRFARGQGALQTARALGEQLVWLAERAGDPMQHLEAHDALGTALFYLGDYAAARLHAEQGMAHIHPTTLRPQALQQGEASGLRCLGVAAQALWCLGYPAQAVQRSQDALALAQELAHPYSLAAAQHWATSVHYRRREVLAVQTQAESLLALATAQQFPVWEGHGMCWHGWALALQGQGQAGLAQLRQGMAAVLATGQALFQPLYLILLAEAAGHGGQVAEGLGLLDEARRMMAANGQGDLLAEVHRLHGALLLLQQPKPDEVQAAACFQQALTIARRQEAKALELRATMSLARLWQEQGKRTEAHDLLAPIYGWFTEGFATADLQEAKALLDELGGSTSMPR